MSGPKAGGIITIKAHRPMARSGRIQRPALAASVVAARGSTARVTCAPLFATGMGRAFATAALASGASECNPIASRSEMALLRAKVGWAKARLPQADAPCPSMRLPMGTALVVLLFIRRGLMGTALIAPLFILPDLMAPLPILRLTLPIRRSWLLPWLAPLRVPPAIRNLPSPPLPFCNRRQRIWTNAC